jgi:high-affinity K+ transport system ATPase subunit B
VTGGTRVLSDWLVVRVTANPGESFLDRMISMVESARRQKTPNEIALMILLVKLTIVFMFATVTLLPFSAYSVEVAGNGAPITITVLVALLVCLIPTTIGDYCPRSVSPASAHAARERHRNVRSRPSKPPAMSTCCCSTRPARSRSATVRHRRSCTQAP